MSGEDVSIRSRDTNWWRPLIRCDLRLKTAKKKKKNVKAAISTLSSPQPSSATMSIRLINTSREVIEFPTVQEAYDFVLSLDTPMAFRTDAPDPVCIPIDPESNPNQLSLRTYAILRRFLISSFFDFALRKVF